MKDFTSGPFDGNEWPDKLSAHVVSMDEKPAVHGYDVEEDLVRNYHFSDFIFLNLTGELPESDISRAFEVAMFFLAPITVAEAPSHAAGLAQLCGGTTSSVLATGMLALAEQARFTLDEHANFLRWLDDKIEQCPEIFYTKNSAECASVRRMALLIKEAGLDVPVLQLELTRMAAILAIFYACGLTRREWIETAFVLARSPCMAAEALAVSPGNLRAYPVNLPRFRYEERK